MLDGIQNFAVFPLAAFALAVIPARHLACAGTAAGRRPAGRDAIGAGDDDRRARSQPFRAQESAFVGTGPAWTVFATVSTEPVVTRLRRRQRAAALVETRIDELSAALAPGPVIDTH